eukprot:s940_g4.t1
MYHLLAASSGVTLPTGWPPARSTARLPVLERPASSQNSFDIKLACAVGGLAVGARRSSKCLLQKLQVRATPKLPVEEILEDLRSALHRPPHAAVLAQTV